jgi:hypothetical protein
VRQRSTSGNEQGALWTYPHRRGSRTAKKGRQAPDAPCRPQRTPEVEGGPGRRAGLRLPAGSSALRALTSREGSPRLPSL